MLWTEKQELGNSGAYLQQSRCFQANAGAHTCFEEPFNERETLGECWEGHRQVMVTFNV